ncbi:MAG TPA: divalent-cation tolerance protein CutA [Acidimicrobiales bacterium]|nr:divalent-cation tolerance protein CutA [Acidimicrobiales bacterium]
MADELCEVIITADDAEWLAGFSRRLVEDRLAACGHNIAPIRSLYRWQGAVHDEVEARLALHTRSELVPEIVRLTEQEHGYDLPAICSLPITGGSTAYLQWIRDETRAPR